MIPVKVLAVRYLANAAPELRRGLGAPKGYASLGLLTTDCDDATYIALDQATKAAEVEVCFARSFYAGAANAPCRGGHRHPGRGNPRSGPQRHGSGLVRAGEFGL